MEKDEKELLIAYRQCFSTNSGRIVLHDMLLNAGFFECNLSTPEEIAVENFAKAILNRLGIYNLDKSEQSMNFVNKLFELPV